MNVMDVGSDLSVVTSNSVLLNVKTKAVVIVPLRPLFSFSSALAPFSFPSNY